MSPWLTTLLLMAAGFAVFGVGVYVGARLPKASAYDEDDEIMRDALVQIAHDEPFCNAGDLRLIAAVALDDIGWEPSEEDQGLIPIPKGYAEP